MKKTLLIPDDLPEAESQENVQKIPCQSGHVDPERGGRSKSSGLTPQKHIKEQFIKKRGAAEYDEKSRLQESYNVPLHLRIFDQCHGGFDMARQAGNDVRFSVCPWELLYTRNGRDKPDIKSEV